MKEDKKHLWNEMEELIHTQLDLQVRMQFGHHFGFMDAHGLKDCKTVFDLGTGNGSFIFEVAKRYPSIQFTGVDNKENMLAPTEKKVLPNVNWLHHDITDQKGIAGLDQADAVFMRYVLLHLPDAGAFIINLFQTLKPGARLWIVDLDVEQYRSEPQHKIFDLVKNCVKDFCDEYGKEANYGSKLIKILKEAGFKDIVQEVEPLDSKTVSLEMLQQFIKTEMTFYREFVPGSLSEAELDEIKSFLDDLPHSKVFINYGVSMLTGIKDPAHQETRLQTN